MSETAEKPPLQGGIKHWPEQERPREKLFAAGPASLSPAELLALLLRTGEGRGRSALDLGRELWHSSEANWGRLLALSPAEIAKVSGIGRAKAASIVAAMEIARRSEAAPLSERAEIRCAGDVHAHFRGRLCDLAREEFHALLLDARGRLLRDELVSVGTLSESLVHPREAFRAAVRESAAGVIFVHNHPSGDPSPSRDDVTLTAKLLQASKVLDIRLADHVIVATRGFFSFVESGNLS